MTKVVQNIIERASKLNKNIVLPEAEDSRVVIAACEVARQGFATITLLGDEAQIKAQNPDCNLEGVVIINPETYEHTDLYAKTLFQIHFAN